MKARNLDGRRDREQGRAAGPAAGGPPPAPLGPAAPGAERHLLPAAEGKRKAANFRRMRPEVGVDFRDCAAEAASPIGSSRGRHDFRESEERKSRRPPSPRFIGRGCRRSRGHLDASVACAASSPSRGIPCLRRIGVRGNSRRAATSSPAGKCGSGGRATDGHPRVCQRASAAA
jgi:hypothetical protein